METWAARMCNSVGYERRAPGKRWCSLTLPEEPGNGAQADAQETTDVSSEAAPWPAASRARRIAEGVEWQAAFPTHRDPPKFRGVGRPSESTAASDVQPRSRVGEAARLAAVGAVVTALITAILSPSTFGAVLDWFGKGETESKGTTSRAAVNLEAVQSRDGSLTIRIPKGWGSGGGTWNLAFAGHIDAGSAMKGGVGAGLTSSSSFDEPNLYLGASAKAAERLQLPGRQPQELEAYATVLSRFLDYTLEGCTLGREARVEKLGFVGRYRVWEDCRSFEGTRFWDAYYIDETGEVLLSATLVSAGATTEAEELEMMTDWSSEAGATSNEQHHTGRGGDNTPCRSGGTHHPARQLLHEASLNVLAVVVRPPSKGVRTGPTRQCKSAALTRSRTARLNPP